MAARPQTLEQPHVERSSVSVTRHAREQAVARFPAELRGLARADIDRLLAAEVAAAITAGRMAARQPRWSLRAGMERRPDARGGVSSRAHRKGVPLRGLATDRKPTLRFVWTDDQRRLFLVRRGRPSVVITCIRPDLGREL